MESPLALIIFNRRDTTERVFSEIAKVKPKKLFVIADGPRSTHPDDPVKCDAARRVVDRVNWDCEVLKNYSDENLGCGHRMATGISWVFEHVDQAIFLEDDCVPHISFFRYCDELLDKYHGDERVMTICGTNSLSGRVPSSYSYSFRYIMSCSGWATWHRAWKHFDLEMKLWKELRETNWMLNILREPRFVDYWKEIFDKYHGYQGNDVWDYQWMFACWTQNAFAVVPEVNLIQNIGFDENSTHCKNANHPLAFLPIHEINFPLRHPPYIARDLDAELINLNSFVEEKEQLPLYKRGIRKLRRWVA